MSKNFKVLLIQFRLCDEIKAHELRCIQTSSNIPCDDIRVINATQPINSSEAFDNADLIILGGSGDYSIFDSLAGWEVVNSWLEDAFLNAKPVLGLCLGAQYLAHFFGGVVISDYKLRELGSCSVELTNEGRFHPLFSDFPERFIVQSGHNQTITELPNNAVVLAKNHKAIQAFYWPDTNIYGIQFHPELTKADMLYRVNKYKDDYASDASLLNSVISSAEDSLYTNKFIAKYIAYVKGLVN